MSEHQIPVRSVSSLALSCQLHRCGFGSAAAGDGSSVVVGCVQMESSVFYAGCACFACEVAWPAGAVYVCGGGAGEAVLFVDAAVFVGAGLVAGLTVVRSSLSACHCSGLAETDRKDMVVISGPSEAYWYLVEHPVHKSRRALDTQMLDPIHKFNIKQMYLIPKWCLILKSD